MDFEQADDRINEGISKGGKAASTIKKYNMYVKGFKEWAMRNIEDTQGNVYSDLHRSCGRNIDILTQDSVRNIMRYLDFKKQATLKSRVGTQSEGQIGYPSLEQIRAALIWYYGSKLQKFGVWNELTVTGNPASSPLVKELLESYKKEDRGRIKKQSRPLTLKELGIIKEIIENDANLSNTLKLKYLCILSLLWYCWLRIDEGVTI